MRLEDCCINITDGEHGTVVDNLNGSFFLLSNKNIVDSQIIITNEDRRIDHNTFLKINRRTKLEVGDVLISTVGTIGKTAVIEEDVNFVFQRSVGIIKPDQKILNPYYLKYLLDSEHYQTILTRSAKGAVQKCIFIGDLKDLYVNLPSIEEQERTISILRNLDRKISLNRSINAKLERMAKEVYDYWFVQFDFPDEHGRPYKSSGGAMVYNPVLKKEVPQGWEVVPLKEIEENIITGKTPSTQITSNFGGNIPFITIEDIRNSLFVHRTVRTLSKVGADSQKNKYLPEGSLCCSCIGTVGEIGFVGKNSQTNQQINSIVFSDFTVKEYVYFSLKNYFEFAKAKVGNVFPNMNKEEFSAILIVKPTKSIVETYHSIVSSYFNAINNTTKQNIELEALRDELLPLLMTGQVKIK